MDRILDELYYGNIRPNENIPFKKTDYFKWLKKIADNESALLEKLNGSERELFSDLMKAQSELTDIAQLENFKMGFKLGTNLMKEIEEISNSCFTDIQE